MTYSCLLGRHAALPSDVRNLGLRISQCRCCGRDLIHRRGRWTELPRGFRIVWRRLDEVIAEAVPLKLVRNLPVPGRIRQDGLFGLGQRLRETIDLAGAALRLMGWAIADRWRLLRASLLAPQPPRQLVLPF